MSGKCVRRDRVPDVLRYYFDEHFAELAEPLRKRGIDVLTTQEAGRAGHKVPDWDQLAYATSLGRVIVTKDHHFDVLAYTHQPHMGIIRIQRENSLGNYIDYLEYVARVFEPEYMRNRLEYYEW